jgi:Protein of unknown function (DUF3570)
VRARRAGPASRAAAVAVSRAIAVTIVATTGLALAATRNWAQDNEINVQFHTFQDTRGVTVLSPAVDLSKDFTDRISMRVNFGVDAISAASDSCARCHREGVNSRREGAGLSITRKFENLKVTAGAAYSTENFYRSTTLLTSVSRAFSNGNTTVAGGFTFSLNQPTLHPTHQVENQYSNDGYVSATQTLTKTTIAQIGYELARVNGFQSNPFLRADVNGIMLLGQVPETRMRQTLTARLRQALPADTYLEADYRRYFDDWQIRSNALSVGLSHHFTPQLLGGFTYRWYDQTAAYFYQPQYMGPVPEFFTADFRLEPFNSGNYTGKVTMTPNGQVWWMPRGTGLTLQYERYRASNGFQAGIFSAGLRIPLASR